MQLVGSSEPLSVNKNQIKPLRAPWISPRRTPPTGPCQRNVFPSVQCRRAQPLESEEVQLSRNPFFIVGKTNFNYMYVVCCNLESGEFHDSALLVYGHENELQEPRFCETRVKYMCILSVPSFRFGLDSFISLRLMSTAYFYILLACEGARTAKSTSRGTSTST